MEKEEDKDYSREVCLEGLLTITITLSHQEGTPSNLSDVGDSGFIEAIFTVYHKPKKPATT